MIHLSVLKAFFAGMFLITLGGVISSLIEWGFLKKLKAAGDEKLYQQYLTEKNRADRLEQKVNEEIENNKLLKEANEYISKESFNEGFLKGRIAVIKYLSYRFNYSERPKADIVGPQSTPNFQKIPNKKHFKYQPINKQ